MTNQQVFDQFIQNKMPRKQKAKLHVLHIETEES